MSGGRAFVVTALAAAVGVLVATWVVNNVRAVKRAVGA